MTKTEIFKNASESLWGKLEKAVIEITDNRCESIEVKEGKKSTKVSVTDISKGIGLDKIKVAGVVQGPTTKKYIVRFNPSELNIQARGGEPIGRQSFDGKGGTNLYAAMEVFIMFNVRLVFDEMHIEDCFMEEIVSKKYVAVKAYQGAKHKRNSVQGQVEGFVAALRNPYTRNVTFRWGKLEYSGVLNYLNTEYTMFSTQGRPVRAIVDIGIKCVDRNIDKNQSVADWNRKYEEAFGNGDTTSLESVGQNVSNLFNINL